MDAALVLSLALSGVIGFALGVFGGGGSILAVPMLVFVTRVAPSAAIGMSLALVGATSLTVGYAYHRRGRVRLKVALLFGGSGIVTAFLGARLTHYVSGDVLLLSFAGLMVLVGCWMLLSARRIRSIDCESGSESGARRTSGALALDYQAATRFRTARDRRGHRRDRLGNRDQRRFRRACGPEHVRM